MCHQQCMIQCFPKPAFRMLVVWADDLFQCSNLRTWQTLQPQQPCQRWYSDRMWCIIFASNVIPDEASDLLMGCISVYTHIYIYYIYKYWDAAIWRVSLGGGGPQHEWPRNLPLLNRNEALLEELGTDLQARHWGPSFFQPNRDLSQDWFSLDFL